MKATVKLLEGVSFSGVSGSGHSVVMDGSPDFGGQNRGMRPMEMLLLGLGGCSAFDVVHILRKGRQDVAELGDERGVLLDLVAESRGLLHLQHFHADHVAAREIVAEEEPDDVLEPRLGGRDGQAHHGRIFAEADVHLLDLARVLSRREIGDERAVGDRKSTRLNSSHMSESRMPSSA